MPIEGTEIALDVAGLGIVFHSPKYAEHIAEGADYLALNYTTEEQVQSHIQKGTIVGFGTGSPGTYILRFYAGYPTDDFLQQSDFKLRLGLHCSGGAVCFRDLYELMDWRAACPASRTLTLEDGFYHVTLCSNHPSSGLIGDNQLIIFNLQKLDKFPILAKEGMPILCI